MIKHTKTAICRRLRIFLEFVFRTSHRLVSSLSADLYSDTRISWCVVNSSAIPTQHHPTKIPPSNVEGAYSVCILLAMWGWDWMLCIKSWCQPKCSSNNLQIIWGQKQQPGELIWYPSSGLDVQSNNSSSCSLTMYISLTACLSLGAALQVYNDVYI